jgi:hypothetical protein
LLARSRAPSASRSELDAARLTFHTRGLDTLNLVLALVMFGVALDLRVADFRKLLDGRTRGRRGRARRPGRAAARR